MNENVKAAALVLSRVDWERGMRALRWTAWDELPHATREALARNPTLMDPVLALERAGALSTKETR